MTIRKSADTSKNRGTATAAAAGAANSTGWKKLPLEELLRCMNSRAKDRRGGETRQRTARLEQAILGQSVYSFFAACLEARGLEGADAESVQDWIGDCVEAVLDEKNTRFLTMRQLANRIAEAVNAEDTGDEDRWALYELCFMLTAQMNGEEVRFFKHADLCARRGTPTEPEPRSLYKRAFDVLIARDFRPRKGGRGREKMTLEQLLQSMDGESKGRQELFRKMSLEQFLYCCLGARNHEGPSGEVDACSCMIEEHRFLEAARVYGGREWTGLERVTDLVSDITVGYLNKTETRDVPQHEVLQAYELCYEFINLMADEVHCGKHRSLMQVEGLPAQYDIDLLQEARLEADMDAAAAFEEYERQQRNAN